MLEPASSPSTPEFPGGVRFSHRATRFLLLGLAVREALSFWTGHPFDLESFIRTGAVVAHGGNPYALAAPPVPGASFAYLGGTLPLASYPPFWPELLGGLFGLWTHVGGGDRFALYWLLKQPGIAADLATAYVLGRLAIRSRASTAAVEGVVAFWSLFPYAIVITAVWGQFDSIVVVLILALFYARGPIERNLLYGLGILAKWFSGVFLPLELFRSTGWRRAAVVLALGVPIGLGVLPFALQGWSLPRFSTLAVYEAHGNGLGMNYVYALTFGSGEGFFEQVPHLYTALAFLWVPVAVATGWVAARWVKAEGSPAELRALLFVVAGILLVRWGLYEQYFLYLFSLAALDLWVFHPGRRALYGWTVGLATAQLLANNDLGLRFFVPIDPSLLNTLLQLEASDGWGAVRAYVLLGLAIAMTITLVQLVWTFLHNEARPQPWPTRLAQRIRARPAGGAEGAPR
jgi:glycosyl transferase family 87